MSPSAEPPTGHADGGASPVAYRPKSDGGGAFTGTFDTGTDMPGAA
ncbi:hypothetical protein [Dactylosporangium sp. CA-092794]